MYLLTRMNIIFNFLCRSFAHLDSNLQAFAQVTSICFAIEGSRQRQLSHMNCYYTRMLKAALWTYSCLREYAKHRKVCKACKDVRAEPGTSIKIYQNVDNLLLLDNMCTSKLYNCQFTIHCQ